MDINAFVADFEIPPELVAGVRDVVGGGTPQEITDDTRWAWVAVAVIYNRFDLFQAAARTADDVYEVLDELCHSDVRADFVEDCVKRLGMLDDLATCAFHRYNLKLVQHLMADYDLTSVRTDINTLFGWCCANAPEVKAVLETLSIDTS